MSDEVGLRLAGQEADTKRQEFKRACIIRDVASVERLIKAIIDVKDTEADSSEVGIALKTAVERGNLDILNILIKAGVHINKDNDGGTIGEKALAKAIFRKNFDCVTALLAAGVDVNQNNKNGITIGGKALVRAAHSGHLDCFNALIRAGVDVNQKEKDGVIVGGKAFMIAADRGHLDCLIPLIKAGVDVNQKNKDGITIGGKALVRAAHSGHLDCFNALIRAGVDVNQKDKDGVMVGGKAFMNAADRGHLDCLISLIKTGVDVNQKEKDGVTMGEKTFMIAADRGHLDCLIPLMEAGVNVNQTDTDGVTMGRKALISAARHGHCFCLNALIGARLMLNKKDKDGVTVGGKALKRAANHGHLDCFKALIRAGVNINQKDKDGVAILRKALMSAAGHGYLICLKALIEAGIDLYQRDKDGVTMGGQALVSAANHGHLHCLKALIETGVNVNQKDKDGVTMGGKALVSAVNHGHLLCLKALVEDKVNVNQKDKDGVTMGGKAVVRAANHGHHLCLKALFEAGVNVNQKDNDGVPMKEKALMSAAGHGHLICLKALIETGIDSNQRDKDGETVGEKAFMSAVDRGHLDCLIPLIKAGIDVNKKDKYGVPMGGKALMSAAGHGHLTCLNALIEAGIDLNQRGKDGVSLGGKALISAAGHGHLTCLNALSEAGIDLHQRDKDGVIVGGKAFMSAADGGHLDCLIPLIKAGIDVNQKDKNGVPIGGKALVSAAGHGHLICFSALREGGIDLNQRDKDGVTVGGKAFMSAADRGHLDCLIHLIKAGIDVNQEVATFIETPLCLYIKDKYGVPIREKALISATGHGHLTCLNALIEPVNSLKQRKKVETATHTNENKQDRSAYLERNDLIKKCVSFECDINTQDIEGRTALFILFENFDIKPFFNSLLEDLLNIGLDVNIPNYEGTHVIHLASSKGSCEQLQKLNNKNAKLDVLDKYQRTPLHIAVLYKNKAAINFFLKNTESKSAKDVDGNTAVHYAAIGNNEVSTFQDFNNLGYDMKLQNIYLKNALHYASANEETTKNLKRFGLPRSSLVEFLVKCGISPSLQDIYARTSLMYACKTGSLRTVDYLRQFKETLNLQDLEGNTALHFACQRSTGKKYVTALIWSAKLDVQNNLGKTPLLIALEEHNYDIALTLLDHNANGNVEDYFQRTALHYAVICNNEEGGKNKHIFDIIKRLLKNHANVNTKDVKGMTPLHNACMSESGHKIAKMLIKHKCDINVVDNFGRHPFLIAAEHGCVKLLKYVLNHSDKSKLPLEIKQSLIQKVIQKSDKRLLRHLLHYDRNIVKSCHLENIVLVPRNKKFLELLLKHVDIKCKFAKEQTILHRLCIEDDIDMIQHTLDIKGCDINAKDENGTTALHLAMQYSELKVIKLLLKKGASLTEVDQNKALPIHFACRYANKNAVECVLKKIMKTHIDLNLFNTLRRDRFGRGFLQYAILNKNHDVLQLLFDCELDTCRVDGTGKSIMHYVGQHLDSENIVDCLVKHGVFINRRDELGMTPMHYAAKYGNKSTLIGLINHKGKINETNNQGNTSLHIAVIYNKIDAVTQLIKKKANCQIRNECGQTAVHIAALSGLTDIFEKLLTVDYNIEGDKDNNTILHLACKQSHVAIVHFLLQKHQTKNILNLKNYQQRCAIHFAAESGSDKIVYLLSVNGADLDNIDQTGNAPLHLCVKNSHTSTALQLIRHGADINLKDKNGLTPLQVLVIQNQTQLNQVPLNQKALQDIFDFLGKKPEDYVDESVSCSYRKRYSDEEKNEIITTFEETSVSLPICENVCLIEMQERKLITGDYIYVPTTQGKKTLEYVKDHIKPETLQFLTYTPCTQKWDIRMKINMVLLKYTCLFIAGILKIVPKKQLERQCHDLNFVLSDIKAKYQSFPCSVKDLKIELKHKNAMSFKTEKGKENNMDKTYQKDDDVFSKSEEAKDTLFQKIQQHLRTTEANSDAKYFIDMNKDKPRIPEKWPNTFQQNLINLECVCDSDWSPLHMSILLGVDEIALMLLKNSVDIHKLTLGILPTSPAPECEGIKLSKSMSPLLLATILERHRIAHFLSMGNIDEGILRVCLEFSFGEEMERSIILGICRKLEWKYNKISLKAYPGYFQGKPFDRKLLGLSKEIFRTREETFWSQDVLIRNQNYVDENDAKYQAQMQYPLKPDQGELINKAILFHAPHLWQSHALLNAIAGAAFIKTQLQPCVVLYTTIKNFIPIHERSFPETLKVGESLVAVIVLEGNFVLGPKRHMFAELDDQELCMGSAIGKLEGPSGTVGPMVDLNGNKLGFLTCAHVFFSEEIKQRGHLNFEHDPRNQDKNVIAVSPTDYDMDYINKKRMRRDKRGQTTSRLDLDESSRTCGMVIRGLFKTDGDVGLDVALVEITKKSRMPEDGSFIVIRNAELVKYGFEDDPYFNTGKTENVQPCDNGIQVFKIGAHSGITSGRVISSGLQAKAMPENEMSLYCCTEYETSLKCEHSPPKYIFKGQINIQSEKNDPFFGAGDSGSGVFIRNKKEKTELNCVGIAIGYVNAERTLTTVTPIQSILSALGDVKLKDFKADSEKATPATDCEKISLTTKALGKLHITNNE